MLTNINLGNVSSIADVNKLIADLQLFVNQVLQQVPAITDAAPSAGQIRFAVRTSTGWELWSVVAGAGVTLTLNTGTKTCTITSP